MASPNTPYVVVSDGNRLEYQESEVHLRRPLPSDKRSSSPNHNPNVIKVRRPAVSDDLPRSTTSSTIEGDDVVVEYHHPSLSRYSGNTNLNESQNRTSENELLIPVQMATESSEPPQVTVTAAEQSKDWIHHSNPTPQVTKGSSPDASKISYQWTTSQQNTPCAYVNESSRVVQNESKLDPKQISQESEPHARSISYEWNSSRQVNDSNQWNGSQQLNYDTNQENEPNQSYVSYESKTAKRQNEPNVSPTSEYESKYETHHYVVPADGDHVMLIQTPEQQNTLRRVLVIREDGVVAVGASTTSTAPGSPYDSRTTSPISRYDNHSDTEMKHKPVEYRNLNNTTIKQYYGEVTPYGTIARTEKVEGNDVTGNNMKSGVSNDNVSRTGSTIAYPTLRSTTSPYGTIMRRDNGGYTVSSGVEPEVEGGQLDYVDFVPKRLKRKQSFNENKSFQTFRDCMEQVNDWILENTHVVVKNCESLYQRLDHSHRVNPESTTSHDRSYVIGLRVWFSCIGDNPTHQSNSLRENNCVRRLEYVNVIPRYKNEKLPEGKIRKPKDCPEFEDLEVTLKRFNDSLVENPLPGKIISVETIPINYSQAFRGDGAINPDLGYWCLEFQGHWSLFIIRVFYERLEAKNDYEIGFEDFCPAPTKTTPSCPEFQTLTSLNSNASRWLLSNTGRNVDIINCQLVEIPFKLKSLVANKGRINTKRCGFEPTKISAYWNTIRVLRIWYSHPRGGAIKHMPGTLKSSNIIPTELNTKCGIAVRTFSPCQVTTSSCCGARKPLFAPTADTVHRINQWIEHTGAEVIAVQTDSVEKWNGKRCHLGETLEDRAYNRQDCPSSIARSSLNYKLTVFRVYVRADSLGKHPEPSKKVFPPCPPPVEPCCCFVGGCSVM